MSGVFTRRSSLAVSAVLVGCLAFSACSDTQERDDASAPVFTRIEAPSSESPDGDPAPGSTPAAKYSEIDSERFRVDQIAYVLTVPGTGSTGCIVPVYPDRENGPAFACDIDFSDADLVADVDLGYPAPGKQATAMRFDPVTGFYTFSASSDSFSISGPALEPGERVTLDEYTFTRENEDTLVVERGAHSFKLTNGEVENHSPSVADKVSTGISPEGSVCGFVTNAMDVELAVVASKNNTDCTAAAAVVEKYFDPDTPVGGSAAMWDSPDGWHCGRGYLAPGLEDFGANKAPVCSKDGAGAVTMIDAEELS